ncbi:MAG: NTP transferase domain-containing protein [Acidobacteriota bacterium]
MDVVAILLAAGESERMGTSKALLPWHGQTLLAHQLRQIQRSRITECVVVLGREADSLAPIVESSRRLTWKSRAVYNPRYREGKTTSIQAGLASLFSRPDGVIVAAVDQPLDRRLLDALLRRGEEEWEWGGVPGRRTILVPVFQGRRGHPPLFSGALIGELMGICEEREGLRAVVRRDPGRVLEVPWDSPEVLLNLNAAADLPPAARPGGPGAR